MKGSAILDWLPIILIILVFWLLIIRPQQRRQRERANLLNALSVGDHVVTIGGIHGTVVALRDSMVELSVGDGQRMMFERSAIGSIRERASVPEIEQSESQNAD